jgi:hypothetical protein
MAVLFVTEFARQARDASGYGMVVGEEPPAAQQTVAIGATSTQSAAFNAATRFVRLHADAVCSVEFGASPTATATSRRLAANQTEYFGIPPNGTYKVAVITNT